MTALVWTLISTFLSFAVTVIVCNINGIQIQPELITGFIIAITGELATMGGIQMHKVKHQKKKEVVPDE